MKLVITKTPLRLSLFGGGTDIKSFYKKFDGLVLSLTIDKFLYVAVKKNQKYVDYKYRIFWSKTEVTNSINKIKHPLAREILKYFKVNFPVEISTFSDVPANTGMGSSSSFAVGLIKGLSILLNKKMTNIEIAKLASYIEINVLKRNIGKQDHFAASIGGLNLFKFKKTEEVIIKKLKTNKKILDIFRLNFILFYLNKKRDASKILIQQKTLGSKKLKSLLRLKKLALLGKRILLSKESKEKTLKKLGYLMNESWQLKKNINSKVSYKYVDDLYKKLKKNGFYGGKLLGAGGGGYLFGMAPNVFLNKFIKSNNQLESVKIKFSKFGTRVIYKT